MTPQILARTVEYACPWFDVIAKDVQLDPPRGPERFWSVRTGAYAAVLAVTEDGRIPLVRQFRPAVEQPLLELPSGGVEPDETPEQAIRRELREETGCEAGEVRLLGRLYTDSGRMETVQWAFFAPNVRVTAAPLGGDEQLELVFVEPPELRRLVVEGRFVMSIHLGVIGTAVLGGCLDL